MPRGGPPNYTYTYPAGTAAVSGQPISSAAYNAYVVDVQSTFNATWPTNLLNTAASSTAGYIVLYDSNGNLSSTNFLSGYATTATAAGTTTLTVTSGEIQVFTGVTTQTVKMPVTSTLTLGQSFLIANQSTGVVTIQSSGSNTITTVGANQSVRVYCVLTSGTSASSWFVSSTGVVIASGKTLTVSNTLTLAGTDGTTMTFPATSSTVLTIGNTALLGVGYTVTSYSGGTISSGTYTPAAANGNLQYITNNGAFTMAVPAADCTINILVTNGASAGTITITGYTVGSNTGDAYTTTNTSKFIFQIVRINGTSTYSWKALQ